MARRGARRSIHRTLQLRLTLALLAAASAFACHTNRLRHLDFAARTGVRWERVAERRAATPPQADGARDGGRATPAPPPKGPQPIVAVFDIENRGAEIDAEMIARLSEYLSARLAAAGRYQVVPRDQLKQRLSEQKQSSYKQCYAQSCQIEIGKELAAQKSLSTQIVRLGSRCMVTAVFYDLRTSTSEGGASNEGPCQEDDLVKLIQRVIAELAARPR